MWIVPSPKVIHVGFADIDEWLMYINKTKMDNILVMFCSDMQLKSNSDTTKMALIENKLKRIHTGFSLGITVEGDGSWKIIKIWQWATLSQYYNFTNTKEYVR